MDISLSNTDVATIAGAVVAALRVHRAAAFRRDVLDQVVSAVVDEVLSTVVDENSRDDSTPEEQQAA